MNTTKSIGDVWENGFYRPKVSIIIPAYNASNYLAEAIDSALAQTYPNTEIIVVNDGSRDNGATAAVAAMYGDKICYYEKENGGSSSALNVGIANMTGEWFSWLSHDDLYIPEKIEKQIQYLNTLSEDNTVLSEHVLFSACDLIDGKGLTIRKADDRKSVAMHKKLEGFTGNEYLVAEPTEYTFHGCSCLIHRSVFEKIGCFDESLRLLNDRDLWFRIFTGGYRVHFLPDSLVKGRVHAAQVSRSIGYSYHNPEQDMFWARSLNWLKNNGKNNYSLFVAYGCNAYLKTRNKEAAEAFDYAKQLNPRCVVQLFVKKLYCVFCAKMRNLAKNIYIKFKMG